MRDGNTQTETKADRASAPGMVKQVTLRDQLLERKSHLEKQLAEADLAIEILDSQPGISEAFEVLRRVTRNIIG